MVQVKTSAFQITEIASNFTIEKTLTFHQTEKKNMNVLEMKSMTKKATQQLPSMYQPLLLDQCNDDAIYDKVSRANVNSQQLPKEQLVQSLEANQGHNIQYYSQCMILQPIQ